MSFESEKPFNDFQHFARGVRRSGDFTINESELLGKYGSAMMELYKGVRKPKTDEEKVFLEQLNGNEVITDRYARIFSKYLKVIAPRHLHHKHMSIAITLKTEITTVSESDILSKAVSMATKVPAVATST